MQTFGDDWVDVSEISFAKGYGVPVVGSRNDRHFVADVQVRFGGGFVLIYMDSTTAFAVPSSAIKWMRCALVPPAVAAASQSPG